MKRDLELIRKMVLRIEDDPSGWAPPMKIDGYSDAQVGYHAYLIVDAGLAEGQDATCQGSESPAWIISHLTWSGHEFADASRDDTRWKKAMGAVRANSGTVTIAVLTQLLVGLMKGSLGMA